jgi:hypothetical protein
MIERLAPRLVKSNSLVDDRTLTSGNPFLTPKLPRLHAEVASTLRRPRGIQELCHQTVLQLEPHSLTQEPRLKGSTKATLLPFRCALRALRLRNACSGVGAKLWLEQNREDDEVMEQKGCGMLKDGL